MEDAKDVFRRCRADAKAPFETLRRTIATEQTNLVADMRDWCARFEGGHSPTSLERLTFVRLVERLGASGGATEEKRAAAEAATDAGRRALRALKPPTRDE